MSDEYLRALEDARADWARLGRISHFDLYNAVVRMSWGRHETWPERLYYYCTKEVGISIVRGNIWQTDLHQMKDATELRFAIEHFDSGMANLQKRHGKTMAYDVLSHHREFWLGKSDEWDGTKRYDLKLITATCTSQAKDDAGMWDRYGDNGRGLCIGFDRERLMTIIRTQGTFNPNTRDWEMGLVKVCYGAPGCGCLDAIYENIAYALARVKNQDEAEFIAALGIVDVLHFLVSHKSSHYSQEQEYRIFRLVTTTNTWGGPDAFDVLDSGARRFHYANTFWPNKGIGMTTEDHRRTFIPEIILGPLLQDDGKEELRSLLNDLGMEPTVETSALSYNH